MTEQSDRVLALIEENPECGHLLLDDIRAFISRFCVFPDKHCLNAVTLWAAHTHIIKHLHITPRLSLVSPEPGSGKTRVLEILNLLVPEPMFVLNATPATIFRTLAKTQMTLLFDEVDTIWGKRGKDDTHEELRALLNAGYKRGARIPRCVGKDFDVQFFNAYAAVALAGMGNLPDSIRTRSVIIHMRRRMRDEKVEGFNSRRHESIGHVLRDRLAIWGELVGESAGKDFPDMPPGVEDRNEEVWSPLIALADVAGGNWPTIAREACTALIKCAQGNSVSMGIRLLGDLRLIFGHQERMTTATIIDLLISEHSGLDDDAPWADLYGKPINSRKLAELLKPYGVESRKVRINDATYRGYRREDLWDAWQRWLPPTPEPMEHEEHAEQVNGHAAMNVPASKLVPERRGTKTEQNETEMSHLRDRVPHVPYVPAMRR